MRGLVTEAKLKSKDSVEEKEGHYPTAQDSMNISQSRIPLHHAFIWIKVTIQYLA